MNRQHNKLGFSLLEAILVFSIIAILTTTSVFFLKPTENMAKAKNARRKTDVLTLLNGIHQYAVDHSGNFPVCIDESVRNICAGRSCTGVVNSCNLYPIVGKYIVSIPVDPSGSLKNDSQYDVQLHDGRITVFAPNAQLNVEISATR